MQLFIRRPAGLENLLVPPGQYGLITAGPLNHCGLIGVLALIQYNKLSRCFVLNRPDTFSVTSTSYGKCGAVSCDLRMTSCVVDLNRGAPYASKQNILSFCSVSSCKFSRRHKKGVTGRTSVTPFRTDLTGTSYSRALSFLRA